ncbi:hypothetical protein E2C01_095457 [Portunus trituberculatus]|uniref:Uncharacterized protein n=1 Tax=Portunus trituberculatus TaxID=210409 RepID=A0A5B7JT27_PORTR|nr:hypothetical protein [Portunus trituberculatus]
MFPRLLSFTPQLGDGDSCGVIKSSYGQHKQLHSVRRRNRRQHQREEHHGDITGRRNTIRTTGAPQSHGYATAGSRHQSHVASHNTPREKIHVIHFR